MLEFLVFLIFESCFCLLIILTFFFVQKFNPEQIAALLQKRGWRGSTIVFFGGFFCFVYIYLFFSLCCLFCVWVCFFVFFLAVSDVKFQTAILSRLHWESILQNFFSMFLNVILFVFFSYFCFVYCVFLTSSCRYEMRSWFVFFLFLALSFLYLQTNFQLYFF